MTTKRTRWVCPLCDNGILGPHRPRKDNIVRYCLPCSAAEGRLVARNAPTLDKQREAKAAKAKASRDARARRDKARVHARTHLVLSDAAGRVVEVNPDKAVAQIAAAAGMPVPRLTWHRGNGAKGGNGGYAERGHIHLTVREQSLEAFCALAAHELAHIHAGIGSGHSDKWRDSYEHIVKVNWQVGSVYRGGVQHHRYAIDAEIERKLRYASEAPKRKKPLLGKTVQQG